jgi:pimeloyl-ACP methyl ester carboxylesterase
MIDDSKLALQLATIAGELALEGDESASEAVRAGSQRRRRGFNPTEYNGLATLSLIRDQDMLRWGYVSPAWRKSIREGHRRYRPIGAKTVFMHGVRQTPPSELLVALQGLDEKLTPEQDRGLRRYDVARRRLEPVPDGTLSKGSALLLVHGTFGRPDMFFKEFAATPSGRQFLRKAKARYAHVLVFDHPTLSVSPWINALDLEADIARSGLKGPIDVVCHGRGGLVVAWWLRNGKRNVDRVVFVGTPLQGTSLACPERLRSVLDMVINVASTLWAEDAAAPCVAPMMSVAIGLSAILGGFLAPGVHSPLCDAGVSIVPGLSALSPVESNAEIDRLMRGRWSSTPTCYAVVSEFEPQADPPSDPPSWQFLQHFCGSESQRVNAGADAIFEGANDLVVDTKTMSRICQKAIPIDNVRTFRKDAGVHHCNYFRSSETNRFLEASLKL